MVLKEILYLLLPPFLAANPHLSRYGSVVVIQLVGGFPHSFFQVSQQTTKSSDTCDLFFYIFLETPQQISLCIPLAVGQVPIPELIIANGDGVH